MVILLASVSKETLKISLMFRRKRIRKKMTMKMKVRRTKNKIMKKNQILMKMKMTPIVMKLTEREHLKSAFIMRTIRRM